MKSYAQDNEDLILYELLKDVKNGKYIDVGANDPENYSVTKLFYDMGWTGINIEPLAELYHALKKARPNDINLNCGLGEKHGKQTFYVDGMGSTFSQKVAEGYKKELREVEREIMTLQEVYEKYCKYWNDIHFCKIDVEGYEKNVLLGVKDWKSFRPWIFCMESTLPGTATPCFEEWEYILLENGYKLVKEHGINRYYMSNEALNNGKM